MKVVECVKVSYRPELMHALVWNVEQYPQFVPSCVNVEVISGDADVRVTRFDFEKKGLTYSLTTKNTKHFPSSVVMELVDGPFRLFRGDWSFTAIESGSEIVMACDFKFKNRLLQMAAGAKFEQLMREMVQSFCDRADVIYA